MYAVISTHPLEKGNFVDQFESIAEAEVFCKDICTDGWTCTICQTLRTVEAQEPEDQNEGLWAPMTMGGPAPARIREVPEEDFSPRM